MKVCMKSIHIRSLLDGSILIINESFEKSTLTHTNTHTCTHMHIHIRTYTAYYDKVLQMVYVAVMSEESYVDRDGAILAL